MTGILREPGSAGHIGCAGDVAPGGVATRGAAEGLPEDARLPCCQCAAGIGQCHYLTAGTFHSNDDGMPSLLDGW